MRKIAKKLLSLALTLCIALTLLPAFTLPASAADGAFGGGNGSALNNPYLIATAEHLAELARMVNAGTDYTGKFFRLTADISLAGYKTGEGWTPTGR